MGGSNSSSLNIVIYDKKSLGIFLQNEGTISTSLIQNKLIYKTTANQEYNDKMQIS
jgi:hypothetical protein